MAHGQSLAPRRRPAYNPSGPERISKRKIHRRRGACEPCRISKIKCDGRTPCGSCRFERRRHHPCVYSDKVVKSQHSTIKARRKADSDHSTISDTSPAYSPHPSGTEQLGPEDMRESYSQHEGGTVEVSETHECPSPDSFAPGPRPESQIPFNSISFYAVIDEFRKLKPLRGVSAQIVARCSGLEATSLTSARREKLSQTDSVASDDIDSTTHSESESSISTDNSRTQRWGLKLRRMDRLIQQGRFLQAWVDLASVVREAEILEADNHDVMIPLEERSLWRDMWNRTLDLECQLGLLLGRPTCLIRPSILTAGQSSNNTTPEDAMLDITRIELYQHIQALLSLDRKHPSISDQFLTKASEILVHEQFNKIGLCTREEDSSAVRDVQLNIHLLFMVIYCRLASMCDTLPRNNNATLHAEVARNVGLHQPRSKVAYCRKMFRSANFIINIFLSLYAENPDAMSKDLIRCTSVLYTAIVIGIAKLRYEIAWGSTTELLQKLEKTFSEMAAKNPDCTIFRTAVNRLQDLDSIEKPADVKHTMHGIAKQQKRSVQSTSNRTPDPTSTRQDSDAVHGGAKGPQSTEWVKQDSHVPEWVGPPLRQARDYTILASFEPQYDDSQAEDNSFSRDGSVYYSTMGSFNTRPTSATTSFNDSQCYDMNDEMTDDAGEVMLFPLTEPSLNISQTRDFQHNEHAVQSDSNHGRRLNSTISPHNTKPTYDMSLGSVSMPSNQISDCVEVNPFVSQQSVCSINTVPTEITLMSNEEDSSRSSMVQEGNAQHLRTPQRSTRYGTPQWSHGQRSRPQLNRVLSDSLNQRNRPSTAIQTSPDNLQKSMTIQDENRAPSQGHDTTPRAGNTANHVYSQYPQESFVITSTDQTPPQLRSGPQQMPWHPHLHHGIPIGMETSFYDPQPPVCQPHNPYAMTTSMYQDYVPFYPHGQGFVQYG